MSKKKVTTKVSPAASVKAKLGSGSPMDVNLLEQIVKLMSANDLNTVEVRDGDKRVILKRGAVQQTVSYAPPTGLAGSPASASAPAPTSAPASTPAPAPVEETKLLAIKSPMVGTFYSAASPDSKPYVSVGSVVNEETEVCTIEAMKNFLPIKAEVRGTIAKIMVTNGQTVQFGQGSFPGETMITPSKSTRRPLKFKTPEELGAELDRLKNGDTKQRGNWTLPQACRHLAMTIEGNLTPPPSDVPTPEEAAMKDKFFAMVMGESMPENLPIGNPDLIPPPDCTDAEIDRLKAAFQKLATYPHNCIKVGRCGPIPVAELIPLHLAHCAHHLSFQVPLDLRRSLTYANFDAVIADVEQLRKGYVQVGNWTLPQICRHLAIATTNTAKPSTAPATPEQAALRPILDNALATGKIPSGLQAPAPAQPPTDCTDADIDAFIAAVHKAKAYSEPTAAHPRFGPLTLAEFKKIVLAHMAHHLSYLVPITSAGVSN